MKTLNEMRQKIDKLDDQIINLLAQRMQVVEKVGQYKKEHTLPPLAPKRWQKVIQTVKHKAKQHNLPLQMVEKIYELIHKYALIEENKIKNMA